MLIFGIVLFSLLAIGVVGLLLYDSVMKARGRPSPKTDTIIKVLGTLGFGILVLLGIKKLNDQRKLACKRPS